MGAENASHCEDIGDEDDEQGEVADACLHASVATEVQFADLARLVDRLLRTTDRRPQILNNCEC